MHRTWNRWIAFWCLAGFAWLSPQLSGNGLAQEFPYETLDCELRPAGPDDQQSYTTDTGLLLVDGKFIPPPYRIVNLPEGQASVNGILIPLENPAPRLRPVGRRHGGNPIREQYEEEDSYTPAEIVAATLELHGLLACQQGERPFLIPTPSGVYDFLQATISGGDVQPLRLPSWLIASLPELAQNQDFQLIAHKLISSSDQVTRSNYSAASKVKLLERAAYPLSTIGMILVVLATGQLLSTRPPQKHELHLESPEASSNTVKFVSMIIAFSVLDLVWTLLASHDGSMKELNPIGAHLITDPTLLALFKLTTTTLAVGILLHLRRFQRVHLASWWMCLLLTLLTARWLTFNSLLV